MVWGACAADVELENGGYPPAAVIKDPPPALPGVAGLLALIQSSVTALSAC